MGVTTPPAQATCNGRLQYHHRWPSWGSVASCIIDADVRNSNITSQDIAALCNSAGRHFAAAGELFVGPATSSFAFPYLNASMAAGTVQRWCVWGGR